MNEIYRIFSDFCEEHQLKIKLSTIMPTGYESANGTFDVENNTLYFNASMLKDAPEHERIFYLFHELRHALQYVYPERFSEAIRRSLDYVLMYDGTCCKIEQGSWKECKLEGTESYLADAYLGQPYEADANDYAYEKTKSLMGQSEELNRLYAFWKPENALTEKEYEAIYETIDRKINSERQTNF